MSMTSVKMLAATVLLTCGLGLSVGTGWLATADAQTAIPTKAAPTKKDAEAELKQVPTDRKVWVWTQAAVRSKEAELNEASDLFQQVAEAVSREEWKKPFTFKTAKWEYELAEMNATFDAAQFATFLQARESQHWEFLGSTTLGSSGGVFQWLFRRPTDTQANLSRVQLMDDMQVQPYKLGTRLKSTAKAEDAKSIEADIAKSIESEIAILQTKLKELHAKGRMVLPLLPGDDCEMLSKLAEKKFGKNRLVLVVTSRGNHAEGDKDVIEWATLAVKTLRSLYEK